MQQNKSYRMVGLFVLIGCMVFAGIVFQYVSKKLISDDSRYAVMYFEESIQGLNVGSSVVFKGVEVGRVAKINLITNLQDGTFKMPVFVSFRKNKVSSAAENSNFTVEDITKSLIEKGLRARLISSNYLTGQLMIELNMDPSSPAVMRGNGSHIEIPTVISSIGMISQDLQEIPFRENMMQLGNILKELDDTLPAILDNLYEITNKTDSIMDKKANEFSQTMNNFNKSIEQIGNASKSIQNLADYLERHPEALIQGKRK